MTAKRLAIAALVLGVVSLVLAFAGYSFVAMEYLLLVGIPLGFLAFFLGLAGYGRAKARGLGVGLGLAGLLTGAVAALGVTAVFILYLIAYGQH